MALVVSGQYGQCDEYMKMYLAIGFLVNQNLVSDPSIWPPASPVVVHAEAIPDRTWPACW